MAESFFGRADDSPDTLTRPFRPTSPLNGEELGGMVTLLFA